jgi:hypothetical protein
MRKRSLIPLSGVLLLSLGGCTRSLLGADLSLKNLPCDAVLGSERSASLPLPALPPSMADDRSSGSGLELGARLIQAAQADGEARAADSRSDEESFAGAVGSTLDIDLSRLSAEDVSDSSADRAEQALAELGGLAGQVAAATTSEDDTRSDSPATRTIAISRKRWQATLAQIAKTTAENGWTSAFARSLGSMALDGRSDDERALVDLKKKYLIAAYVAQYFRQGAVFALEFNDASLKAALLAKIKSKVSNDDVVSAVSGEIDTLAADYRKKLCEKGTAEDGPCVLFGVIGEQTFVTRAGKSYGFPGITGTIDLVAGKKVSTNKIQTGDIPPDLVRVIMEAIGDESFQVPGEKNSTLCEVRGLCSTDATAKKLSFVNEVGDRVEAGTSSTLGAAIRGGWIASLNNEVLADTLTTAAAVSFRKASEAAAWAAVDQCAVDRSAGVNGYRSVSVQLTK